MDIHELDDQLFKGYILSMLKNNFDIDLLIKADICGNYSLQSLNSEEQLLCLNNLDFLLKYLKENNLSITNWTIKSNCNLTDIYFKIIDLFNKYFNNLNIIYPNRFLNSNIEVLEKYKLQTQNNIFTPFIFSSKIENLNTILSYLDKYHEKLYIIISPKNIKEIPDNLLKVKNYPNIQIEVITNTHIIWTDDQIIEYLQLLDFLIDNHYDLDILNLSYQDKLEDNIRDCPLYKKLTIDCMNLSFPACCGLQNQIFNGGKLSNDIIATEGLNGYINQKNSNIFFHPDCIACENKYFCQKGCQGAQFKYNAEPFIPMQSICKLENSRINFLIGKYHELGLLDEMISKNNHQELISLLVNKGYKEYGYRYY